MSERLKTIKSNAFGGDHNEVNNDDAVREQEKAEQEVAVAAEKLKSFLDQVEDQGTLGSEQENLDEKESENEVSIYTGGDQSEVAIDMKDFSRDIAKKSIKLSETNPLSASLFTTTLSKLGVEGSEIAMYHVPKADVAPLKPQPVKDTEGRVSEIVFALAKKVQNRIIPESMTKIPRHVSTRDHYEFITDNNERYFVPKKDSDQLVDKIVEAAQEELVLGRPFQYTVSTEVEYDGKKFSTFTLSPTEVGKITTLLSAYGAKAVDSGEGPNRLSIVVGDYVY